MIKIGLYTKDKKLIGYKVDSFWSLSKAYPKQHYLENGVIPAHIIGNLQTILNNPQAEGVEHPLIALLNVFIDEAEKQFENVDGLYIGYQEYHEPENQNVVFTHRIKGRTIIPQ